jgi:hypothetical protein
MDIKSSGHNYLRSHFSQQQQPRKMNRESHDFSTLISISSFWLTATRRFLFRTEGQQLVDLLLFTPIRLMGCQRLISDREEIYSREGESSAKFEGY